jgi:single-strand DNA-binding protein
MITQDVSKEEKAQGIKGNILGNGKVFWKEGGQAPQAQGQGFQQQAPQQQPARDPQGLTSAQGGFRQQAPQQQAPKVNPQESTIDFNDDIPF